MAGEGLQEFFLAPALPHLHVCLHLACEVSLQTPGVNKTCCSHVLSSAPMWFLPAFCALHTTAALTVAVRLKVP